MIRYLLILTISFVSLFAITGGGGGGVCEDNDTIHTNPFCLESYSVLPPFMTTNLVYSDGLFVSNPSSTAIRRDDGETDMIFCDIEGNYHRDEALTESVNTYGVDYNSCSRTGGFPLQYTDVTSIDFSFLETKVCDSEGANCFYGASYLAGMSLARVNSNLNLL